MSRQEEQESIFMGRIGISWNNGNKHGRSLCNKSDILLDLNHNSLLSHKIK